MSEAPRLARVALLGFGLGLAYRSSRGSDPRQIAVNRVPDARHRLLVVANQTVEAEALLAEIRRAEVDLPVTHVTVDLGAGAGGANARVGSSRVA